jgi:Putative MetA-pathway of phenol degradation
VRGRVILVASIWLTPGGAAAADPAPICADRPGKATATCTVPHGRLQVETGLADWSLQKASDERDTSLVIGETTVKYGLTDGSDIEFDVTPWQQATSRGRGFHNGASGIGDVDLVYKQQLTSADAALQVTVRPFVKVPTAKRRLGSGKWEGGLLVPIAYSVPRSRLTIALTPELDWVADADGHGHHPSMSQVASLGWQASAKLNLSGEIWGSWDWARDGTMRQYSADAAVAYLLSGDVQLDAGANFGLNRETPDVELYTGIARRF